MCTLQKNQFNYHRSLVCSNLHVLLTDTCHIDIPKAVTIINSLQVYGFINTSMFKRSLKSGVLRPY